TQMERTKSARESARTAVISPATTSTTAPSASRRRGEGENRFLEAIARTSAPTANPAAAVTDPAMISPTTPATSAAAKSVGPGIRRRPATIPAAAKLVAIAEREAKSWWPRKDGWRHPGFQAP